MTTLEVVDPAAPGRRHAGSLRGAACEPSAEPAAGRSRRDAPVRRAERHARRDAADPGRPSSRLRSPRPPAAGPSDEEVTEAVVAIVAEMTGYPPELLDLDLDLEADLGVDTVKQAEVFAAVRARFGVERDETLSLRDFPTLTHVIGWVRDKTAVPSPPRHRLPPRPVAPAGRRRRSRRRRRAARRREITEAVVAIVAEMTGYPTELLDLDLDLEADLGVDTVKQAEVFAAVRARFGVERDETLSLRDFPTLTHVIGWVRDKTARPPLPTAPAPAAAPRRPAAAVAAAGRGRARRPTRSPRRWSRSWPR